MLLRPMPSAMIDHPPQTPPPYPCITRHHAPNPAGTRYPNVTIYTIVVAGPEYRGDPWQIEGRAGYPPAPPFPACSKRSLRHLGVLVVMP